MLHPQKIKNGTHTITHFWTITVNNLNQLALEIPVYQCLPVHNSQYSKCEIRLDDQKWMNGYRKNHICVCVYTQWTFIESLRRKKLYHLLENG
jgi:hypothetical protein